MTIEPKELAIVKSQVSRLENQANEVIITTPDENESAMNLKAKLKETAKNITTRKEEITKPLNAALKSARELFAPLEKQLETADGIIGKKLLAYKQKMDAEAKAKSDAIAKKVEDGKMTLGTAEKKLDKIEETQVAKTTKTDHGAVQFRVIKKVRFADTRALTDIELIALARTGYFVWDEVKARKDALAGFSIVGVEVYEEETV